MGRRSVREFSEVRVERAPGRGPGAARRRLRVAAMSVGILAVSLTASGCTANEVFFLDHPDPATQEGSITENLWHGSWIAAWIVGAVTWGLMLWAAVAYRRRHRNDVPAQTQYNIPIEILYTIVPLIMILGLFWFTARDQSEILALDNDQQHTVNVVGFRWAWGFNYLDEGVYDVGAPVAAGMPVDPATLVLPVGEKVRFELTSPDVIHSFWVPAFLFKMDVIPGKTNAFELTPDKVGVYSGKCAELCGAFHSQMLFKVKVVERAEFDQYIANLKAIGQTGLLDTGRSNDEGQMPDERTT
jgi:cytochrome c oxidase subunit 2